MPGNTSCSVCQKKKSPTVVISRCGRCKGRFYCGSECQTLDWREHKTTCGKPVRTGPMWYDQYRRCEDRSLHEGRLELITWACPEDNTGWGNCAADEADDLKRKFEEEMDGDEEAFFEYWPHGFRWTCCGTDAEMKYGCDHHGTGANPCTCDFCRGGQALPNSIYKEKCATRMGLKLQRGPDPRSCRRSF